MEENKTKKPYKKRRYYNNKNHKRPKEERVIENEEIAEATAALSEKAEKAQMQRSFRERTAEQNSQKNAFEERKGGRSNRRKQKNAYNREKPQELQNDTEKQESSVILHDENDEVIETPSVCEEELEEIEALGDIMLIDGVDDIDLMAEENYSEDKGDADSGITYEVIGVRFGSAAKTYYFDPCEASFSVGDGVIVETARGDKYGTCNLSNTRVPAAHVFLPLKKVLRLATDDDRQINEENIALANEAFKQCNIKIAEHKLDMKLIDATYTHDRGKLIFFFTAPTRVDFRELVKDLASMFRTRIDLRQIGIRDEAKMIGGYGVCGRPLCCCSFLPNFNQVSIKMAKEQNLSLNTSKISGVCGRLMCCLKFEHKTYIEESKLLPPLGSVVRTSDGTGTVTELSPITGCVKVRLNDSQDSMPKLYHKNDVTVLRRGNAPKDSGDDEADSDG